MDWEHRIRAAVDDWREALGPEAVVLDTDAIKAAQTATFATSNRLGAILRPTSVGQVQAALRIATRHATPVYPTSRGRNWGLGSKAPSADRCVLLELGGLNRVRHVDDALGTARLETGVSFREIHDALVEQGATHRVPVIGGPADASVVANMLLRGDRIGPGVGHLDELCDLEIVLPTGELLRTGFGRFGQTHTNALDPWGLGPALSGLFSQSNLGVVTAATIPLRRRAPVLHTFGFSLVQPRLPKVIDALADLVRDGAIAPRCLSFWNEYKRLASEGRHPGTQAPLDPDKRWSVYGSVHAPSQGVARALREHLTPHLEPLGTEHFWDEAPGDPTVSGTPTDANLGSVYWRSRAVVRGELDPNRDGCGLLWLCHLLPFEGAALSEAIEQVCQTVLAAGFEPNLGFQVSSARAVRFFTALAYDRRVPGEDERAMACHDQVMATFTGLGHLPFRLGIQSMGALPPGDEAHDRLVKAIKAQVDPAGILAPGLYERG